MIPRSARTTVMALDSLWPVGRALAYVLQRSESIAWAGLAIDTETWREMLIVAQPDVAMIDPIGFGSSATELVRLTRSISPETKAIIFTPTLAEPIVQRWYDSGAAACISKRMHPDMILKVVRSVHSGLFGRSGLAELLSPSPAIA